MHQDTEYTAPVNSEDAAQDAENSEVRAVSERLMQRNAAVYEELAK